MPISNRHAVFAVWLLGAASIGFAQSASPPSCPWTPQEVSAALGMSFRAGPPEPGVLGKQACTYESGEIKLWVDAGPNPAPSPELWRKMSSPPGTSWVPVPKDPDQAVHMVPRKDVSPFPNLSYARKGWLVDIKVLGAGDAIDAWNAKLLKLKRVP
jgi:hypothetical protein